MTAPGQRDNTILPDISTSSSVVTATVSAPFGRVNIADWLMHLPDREYQRCAVPDHKAAGYTTTDDGRPMSLNVEMIGPSLMIQHYLYEVAEPQHCHLVSLSDILMPAGWTTIQVIWDLSVTDNGDGTCTYHNHVDGHPTADFVAVAQRSGLTIDDAAAASRAATDKHNQLETPNYAASIERWALAHS